MHTPHIARLLSGPLDIVGDIHGELDALLSLLAHLGYDAQARHPDGRRLVFVGDLCDRGHDSPGVIRRVAQWVAAGRAQAVIGNHEFNLLRAEAKEGNGWFFDDNHDHAEGKFHSSAPAAADEREPMLRFFAELPLAAEREDLRVVHACWSHEAIARLQAQAPAGTLAAYDHFDAQIQQQLDLSGLSMRAEAELAQLGAAVRDPKRTPAYLPAVGERDALLQTGNPLRVLTSGLERECAQPFYSTGKWRMVERVRWWDEYTDPVPVVMGHYWRWAAPVDRAAVDKGGADLFEGVAPHHWLGPRGRVFCVDYSVGRRFLTRERGVDLGAAARLGALRWPERVLMFEDGQTLATVVPD